MSGVWGFHGHCEDIGAATEWLSLRAGTGGELVKLSKPICKRCREMHGFAEWGKREEDKWLRTGKRRYVGYVECPTRPVHNWPVDCKGVPEWCLFGTEHVVSQ